MKKSIEINVYTDGACSCNPGPGGIGYAVLQKGTDQPVNTSVPVKSGYRKTTNNRMEILATAKGLKAAFAYIVCDILDKESRDIDIKINVYSDSQVVVMTMNEGWKKKTNNDLWTILENTVAEIRQQSIEVKFHWVKGHAENEWNKLADELAVQARQDPLFIDEVYENIAAMNNTRKYKEEDELAWYVEEEFTYDIHEGFLSEESYKMAKQMVKDHYYIPHGPRKHAMELGDEGFRDFLQLVKKGADPYDALDQAEANSRQRFEAAKEPEIVDIRLCGHNNPGNRRIEILLSNGTTVKVLPCHGGFEQTECTQKESAVTVDIAWKFVGWLNGRSL